MHHTGNNYCRFHHTQLPTPIRNKVSTYKDTRTSHGLCNPYVSHLALGPYRIQLTWVQHKHWEEKMVGRGALNFSTNILEYVYFILHVHLLFI